MILLLYLLVQKQRVALLKARPKTLDPQRTYRQDHTQETNAYLVPSSYTLGLPPSFSFPLMPLLACNQSPPLSSHTACLTDGCYGLCQLVGLVVRILWFQAS